MKSYRLKENEWLQKYEPSILNELALNDLDAKTEHKNGYLFIYSDSQYAKYYLTCVYDFTDEQYEQLNK